HCAGLMGGTLLALMSGARLLIARTNNTSGAHIASVRPTVLMASGADLQNIAESSIDISQLRAVYTGTLPVAPDARVTLRERLGAGIFEAYAVGEAAPIAAINSTTHSREGTVGRLLPAIRMRL